MELKLDLELDKAKIGFMMLGIILGVGLTLGATKLDTSGDEASDQLVSFLENQSGQELEKISAESAGEFYKVDVRTTGDQLSTYYTDGERFTTAMQNIEDIKQRSTALAQFSQCLQNSGTVMFGNSTQRATQTQIQALGGTQVVAPIYQDVSDQRVLQQAAQLGVQQVPAFVNNESAIQGVQTPQQVQQFTGCSLEAN